MKTDGARTQTAMTVPKATLIGPMQDTITSLPTCSCGLSKGTVKALATIILYKRSFSKTSLNLRNLKTDFAFMYGRKAFCKRSFLESDEITVII